MQFANKPYITLYIMAIRFSKMATVRIMYFYT